MFSYFESSVDGIIPNEYCTVDDICSDLFGCIASARDSCMLTARRFWLVNQQLVSQDFPKKIFLFSFSKDSTNEMVNSAQNHPDSTTQSSHSYPNATTKTEASEFQSNDHIQSFTSNNLNKSNVKSHHTKKHK